jgi:hypothetical protein
LGVTLKRSPLSGWTPGVTADAHVGHAPMRTRLLSLLLPDRLVAAQRMVEATRDELSALAGQQAALRRVATLVARGVGSVALPARRYGHAPRGLR